MWETRAGRTVNVDTAIRVSTVFGGARLIGNGMAQVPLKLMQESPNGKSRVPAKQHPLYEVMGLRPNPWQTSFEFRQLMSWHVELAGRFVCFKNAPAGRIVELIPFEPGSVEITRNADLSLKYVVTSPGGGRREFPPETIWHVRGPSWNGWAALNPLAAAREAIGLAIAIEEGQTSLHENGVTTSGAYSVEGKLTTEQHKDLVDWIKREHVGAGKAGVPMILDRAAKWVSAQMTGVDAQTLESRKNQVEEVCRFMGVLPIMLGYSDKASTYASAEQMFLAHAVHTLSPRWEMYEQSMNVNLLTAKERAAGYYFNFVEEGMIRGSAKDTKDVIIGYVNGGIMTPNEGRAKLDLNPDDDPESDELRIPVTAVQAPADGDENNPSGDSAAAKSGAPGSMQVVFGAGAFTVNAQIQTPGVKVDNHVEPATVLADVHVYPAQVQVTQPDVKIQAVFEKGALASDAPVEMKIVSMPARSSTSETERDANGNIKRVKQTERDA